MSSAITSRVADAMCMTLDKKGVEQLLCAGLKLIKLWIEARIGHAMVVCGRLKLSIGRALMTSRDFKRA